MPIFFWALLCLNSSAQQTTANPLEALDGELQAVTSRIFPCVVQISGKTIFGDTDEAGRTDNVIADTGEALGSGIIVSPDGFIITNAHVISGLTGLRVSLDPATGYTEAQANVVGIDAFDDLAVLKIPAQHLRFLNVDDVGRTRQGQLAMAFGSPFGLEHSVTMGIVSDVNRQIEPDDPRTWIQTDAAVNPGNSGGPLIDIHGTLLGINTLNYSDVPHGGNHGVALAIPAATVAAIYHQIIQSGHFTRPYFGISVLPLNHLIAAALHLKTESGLLVQNVDIGSPAEHAGLVAGDVVSSVNGEFIDSITGFGDVLRNQSIGRPVIFLVWHNDHLIKMKIEPQVDHSDQLPLAMRVHLPESVISGLEILGLELTPDEQFMVGPTLRPHGIIVAGRSSTLFLGRRVLQARDIIYQVNGNEVGSLESLRNALAAVPHGSPLVLQIERDRRLMYVPIE